MKIDEIHAKELIKAFDSICDKADACCKCKAAEACDLIGGDELMPCEWTTETIERFLTKE